MSPYFKTDLNLLYFRDYEPFESNTYTLSDSFHSDITLLCETYETKGFFMVARSAHVKFANNCCFQTLFPGSQRFIYWREFKNMYGTYVNYVQQHLASWEII